jgi:hypothetical protein
LGELLGAKIDHMSGNRHVMHMMHVTEECPGGEDMGHRPLREPMLKRGPTQSQEGPGRTEQCLIAVLKKRRKKEIKMRGPRGAWKGPYLDPKGALRGPQQVPQVAPSGPLRGYIGFQKFEFW